MTSTKTFSAASAVALMVSLSGCFAGELSDDDVFEPSARDADEIGHAVEMAMTLAGAGPGRIVSIEQTSGSSFEAVYETRDELRLHVAGEIDESGPFVTRVCRRVDHGCVEVPAQFIWDEGPAQAAI